MEIKRFEEITTGLISIGKMAKGISYLIERDGELVRNGGEYIGFDKEGTKT